MCIMKRGSWVGLLLDFFRSNLVELGRNKRGSAFGADGGLELIDKIGDWRLEVLIRRVS